jgi:hypothetical protein
MPALSGIFRSIHPRGGLFAMGRFVYHDGGRFLADFPVRGCLFFDLFWPQHLFAGTLLMKWYGSFEFFYMGEAEPRVILDDVNTSPLALFREIHTVGHVYRISPDEPIACLQIASESVEAEFGPAPERIRLTADTLQEVRDAIRQKSARR